MLAQLIWLELKVRGIIAFVDTRDIRSPGEFDKKLRKTIKDANAFVCLLADTTLSSQWVNREIRYAATLKKTLIPVFQHSFKKPERPYPQHIAKLLKQEGISVDDKNGDYTEEEINRLAKLLSEIPGVVSFKWANSGDLYWAGADLTLLRLLFSRGVARQTILDTFSQAKHHVLSLELSNYQFARKLRFLGAEAYIVGDDQWEQWMEEHRDQYIADLQSIISELGAFAEAYQKDFRPNP